MKLSPEDFEKIKTPKDKNIAIECFVDLDEVDPIFYDKSYYVNPDGSDRAFLVLLDAMQKQNKADHQKIMVTLLRKCLLVLQCKITQTIVLNKKQTLPILTI